MSEAMTSESIIEAYWLLQNYWVKVRYPMKRKKGGWTDVDILAYNPEKKNLVIAESKVQGPKNIVWAYTSHSIKEYGNIFEWDDGVYLSFLDNIKLICTNGMIFTNFRRMVKSITVQLVSNYYIHPDVYSRVNNDICNKVKKDVPPKIKLKADMKTTFGLVCEIIKLEKESKQGRRYGHPVIDMAREINRYLNPSIRAAGRNKKEIDEIKNNFKDMFFDLVE